MTSTLKSIAIIGRGKVGHSLAHLSELKGYQTELIGRDIEKQQQAAKSADLILITVNDEAITSVAHQLENAIEKGVIIAHCSGILSSDALACLKASGALIASSHPLNTFPTLAASLATFSNTDHASYLYAEGDNEALKVLETFYNDLGFKFKHINKHAKTEYHLACSIACNYLSVLMHTSLNIAESAGLERNDFWAALSPILEKTLDNIGHDSLRSLSGPITRADLDTVQKHQHALIKNNENALSMYSELGKIAAQMAKKTNRLNTKDYERFIETFNKQISDKN